MTNVLYIYKHPDSKITTRVYTLLVERGEVTSVTHFKALRSALKKQYDEVAIVVDSMTTSCRIAKIVASHKSTKHALVSILQNPSLSLRGGISVTCKPNDIPRQLADMTKTKQDGAKKPKT
ncbi:MAG: hypothetical protein RLZZ76_734 [Candidatus Parcubacteria bacterium]|jgi:hypothetical protein